MRRWPLVLMWVCLALGLAYAVFAFLGILSPKSFRTVFLLTSAAYFFFALAHAAASKKSGPKA